MFIFHLTMLWPLNKNGRAVGLLIPQRCSASDLRAVRLLATSSFHRKPRLWISSPCISDPRRPVQFDFGTEVTATSSEPPRSIEQVPGPTRSSGRTRSSATRRSGPSDRLAAPGHRRSSHLARSLAAREAQGPRGPVPPPRDRGTRVAWSETDREEGVLHARAPAVVRPLGWLGPSPRPSTGGGCPLHGLADRSGRTQQVR